MDRLIAPNSVPFANADTAPATGTPQYATEGNPVTNTPATVFPAYAFNAIQEELIAVLAAAGITPDRTNNAQIVSAIKRLVQNQVVLTDTGAVNAYAATNTPPLVAGTWVNGVTQQIVVGHTNTGASTYSPDALTVIPIYGLGLQPLQGNEMFAGGTAIMMKQTIAGVNSGNPIALLLECSGGAQQIPAATQPLHAMQLGQFLSALVISGYIKIPVIAAGAKQNLIIQWGYNTTTNGSVAVTFPIAFPNALFVCAASEAIGAGAWTTTNASFYGCYGGSLSGIGIRQANMTGSGINVNASGNVFWIAIGY